MIWTFVVAQTRLERAETIATAFKRQDNFAIAFEQYVIRTLDSADAMTRYVKREFEKNGDRIELSKLVADLDFDKQFFACVSIFGADGFAIATTLTPRAEPRLNIQQRDHFQAHLHQDPGTFFIGRPVQSAALDKVVVPVSRRLNNPDGSFAGVVLILITPANFTSIYPEAEIQQAEALSLIGADRVVRASRQGMNGGFAEDVKDGELFVQQAKHAIGDFTGTPRANGARQYYSYRTLADYPLIAVVATAEEEILGAFQKREALYFMAAGLASASILMFAALLMFVVARNKRADARIHFQEHLLSAVGQAVIATDLDGVVTYWNRYAEHIYGWQAAAAKGKNIVEIIPAEMSEQQSKQIIASLQRGESRSGQFMVRHRDGRRFFVHLADSPIFDRSGQLIGIVGVSSDITEGKFAEAQLRESEARFKSISSNIPGMVFQLRQSVGGAHMFTYVSDGSIDVCGIAPESLHVDADPFFALLPLADRQSFFGSMETSFRTLQVWDWEGRLEPAGEPVKWLQLRATPRRIRVSTVIWDGVIFNITEAKLREAALDQSQEMFRALSAHQVGVKEEERKRIAREIHDELGQRLTVLRMDILMLPKALGNQCGPMTEIITPMRETIDGILRTVRNIASELRPAALDIGMIFGMEWLVDEFQSSTGIFCKFNNWVGREIDVDDDHATGIFRILQESLTNVARHANAGRIDVTIDLADECLCLQVKDDGVGFESDGPVGIKSYGLVGMRERAAMLGGEIKIHSVPGGGTIVQACIPLL